MRLPGTSYIVDVLGFRTDELVMNDCEVKRLGLRAFSWKVQYVQRPTE